MASIILPNTPLSEVPTPTTGYTATYVDNLLNTLTIVEPSGSAQPIYLCIPNTSATGAITSTETIIAGGKNVNGANAPILPNQLTVGSQIRFFVWGTCNESNIAETNTFTIRCGSAGTTADTSIVSFSTTSGSASASCVYSVEANLTVTSAGSSGAVAGFFTLTSNTAAVIATNPITTTIVSGTINTTIASFIELTYVAGGICSSTFSGGYVEYM